MTARPPRRPWALVLVTSSSLLLWSNLVVGALPPAAGLRAAANAAAATVLVVIARGCGVSWSELGVSRTRWRAGLRWGAGALLVAASVYGALLVVPELRALLLARQPEVLTAGQLAVRAGLVIPLGTVLPEELAFRGVLLAMTSQVLPQRAALAFTSSVFGLWHIASAQSLGSSSATPSAASVTATVAVTGLAGVVFGWMRQRSGSLLAPLGAHLGTNALGLLAVQVAAGRS
jgi:membrane protease YdiL (CAAX protease family)